MAQAFHGLRLLLRIRRRSLWGSAECFKGFGLSGRSRENTSWGMDTMALSTSRVRGLLVPEAWDACSLSGILDKQPQEHFLKRGDMKHPSGPPVYPPPPSPPTPRATSRTIAYGKDTTSSRTPGGTPVPAACPGEIEDTEEPSKLVSKLPARASMRGTAGGDAAVMAQNWLAQLTPSMASFRQGHLHGGRPCWIQS